jgi:hypothetical protein
MNTYLVTHTLKIGAVDIAEAKEMAEAMFKFQPHINKVARLQIKRLNYITDGSSTEHYEHYDSAEQK